MNLNDYNANDTSVNDKKKWFEYAKTKQSVRTRMTNSSVKFAILYQNNSFKIKLLLTTILATIAAIIVGLLAQNTGLYDIGLFAVSQGIGRFFYYLSVSNFKLTPEQGYAIFNIIFWGAYVIINIPLIIFGWKKIGKQFTILTTWFMLVNSLVGIAFGFIPGIDDLYIFGNLKLDSPFQNINNHNFYGYVQLILWNYDKDAIKGFAIFVYALIFGISLGTVYALIFIIDCSSGGFDFFGVWYAEIKRKNFGSIVVIINFISFLIGYIIGSYIPASLAIQNGDFTANEIGLGTIPYSVDLLFSPNFIVSVFNLFLFGYCVNFFFPKYKIARVEIYSSKINEICEKIFKSSKKISLSIVDITGAYSKQSQKMIVTTCMFLDTVDLLKMVREIDNDCLFTVSVIKSIDGYIYTT